MKEQLIEFETAKLAKEKGFKLDLYNGDWEYEDKCGDTFITNSDLSNYKKEDKFNIRPRIECPQSLLQKWLREEYRIIVEVKMFGSQAWDVEIVNYKITRSRDYFKTYEEALEKGLYEALKQI